MGIAGITKNIAITPIGLKNAKDSSVLYPYHIDLRNGNLNSMGHMERRPGFSSKWDIGADVGVELLIPEGDGYAVGSNKLVYKLGDAVAALSGMLNGKNRPTWVNHQGDIIIADGGNPVKVVGGSIVQLGGTPPRGKFIDTLDTFVIISGYNGISFRWSSAANSGVWSTSNENSVLGNGEVIEMMKVYNRHIYFFKTKSIELWVNVGGETVFGRNIYIEKGTESGHSVVQANNGFYFYGNDGRFYELHGTNPQVIDELYRDEVNKINDKPKVVGFNFTKEGIIRWTALTEGLTFSYDYVNNVFSQDNTWDHGQWERMPINSYMEINGESYFGDFADTGKVYHWSNEYDHDDGEPIRTHRELSLILNDNRFRGRVNRMGFRFERGVATAEYPNPKMMFSWRFDRQPHWRYTEIDLGVHGDTNPYVEMPPLGIGREVQMRFTETDIVPFVFTHADITTEALGS